MITHSLTHTHRSFKYCSILCLHPRGLTFGCSLGGEVTRPPADAVLPPPAPALPLLGRAQVGGDGVVLDGLVQHQRQQPRSVCHGHAQVALLLEELVQLVPLTGRNQRKPSRAGLPLFPYRPLTTRTRSRSTSARRSFSQQ